MAGLAAAKRADKVSGRRPVMTPAKSDAARMLLYVGKDVREVASMFGVSVTTLYRHCPASERQA